jgi:amino acid transporter
LAIKHTRFAEFPALQPGLGLALIFVMFAYGGWSDMSYVAADVRDPERNISRSLLLGTATVTAIYLLVTLAFVVALSLPGLRNSQAVAADTVSLTFGAWGAIGISILICISTLGAINGMLFAGGRVFYALGKEDAAFAWLGAWNDRYGGPVRSLVVQSLATLALAIAFGRWADGFERLVVFTGPFYCGFLLLIAFGFFVLRHRGAIGVAGYRAPLYPLPPLLLAAACAYMTYSSTDFAVRNGTSEGYWVAAVVATGICALLFKRWFAAGHMRAPQR